MLTSCWLWLNKQRKKFVLVLFMPRQIRKRENRSRNKTKVTQVLKHFAFRYISTPAYQYRQEYALLQNLVAQVLWNPSTDHNSLSLFYLINKNTFNRNIIWTNLFSKLEFPCNSKQLTLRRCWMRSLASLHDGWPKAINAFNVDYNIQTIAI